MSERETDRERENIRAWKWARERATEADRDRQAESEKKRKKKRASERERLPECAWEPLRESWLWVGESAMSARRNEGVNEEDPSGSCNQCQSVIIHPYMFVFLCLFWTPSLNLYKFIYLVNWCKWIDGCWSVNLLRWCEGSSSCIVYGRCICTHTHTSEFVCVCECNYTYVWVSQQWLQS